MIPITFTFQGKEIKGTFSPVKGACDITFYLNVGGFHWGQLLLTDRNGWQFYSNSLPELNEMSEFFGEYVVGWYE